jgi:cytoskeletal protein CcmA (bactofilin family)
MNEKRTLIEEGTEIKGNLASKCPILVMGSIEGQISGPSMEVAESGCVSGRTKVKELRSRGDLSGEFEADSIELAGRVHDQTVIRAKSISVVFKANGGNSVQFGDCELSVGDAPDKQAAIAEATGGGRKRTEPRPEPRPAPAKASPPSEPHPGGERREKRHAAPAVAAALSDVAEKPSS